MKKRIKIIAIIIVILSILSLLTFIGYSYFTEDYLFGDIISKARYKNKPSLCKLVYCKERRDMCYFNIAEAYKNTDICDYINQVSYSMDCYRTIDEKNINLDLIDKLIIELQGTKKDTMDISECDIFNDQTFKNYCLHNFAWYQNELKFCDLIKGKYAKEDCYSSMANKLEDISLCEEIRNKEEKKRCLTYSASNTSDCDKIKDFTYRYICYAQNNFDVTNLNPKDCIKINSDSIRKSCINKIALANNDFGICENHKFDNDRDHCIISFSYIEKDFDICDKIKSQYIKDSCLFQISRGINDSTICNKLKTQKVIEDCKKHYSKP